MRAVSLDITGRVNAITHVALDHREIAQDLQAEAARMDAAVAVLEAGINTFKT